MTIFIPQPGELYQHYKGGFYKVINNPKDSATGGHIGLINYAGEEVLWYKSTKDNQIWMRSLSEWLEPVERENRTIPRFRRLTMALTAELALGADEIIKESFGDFLAWESLETWYESEPKNPSDYLLGSRTFKIRRALVHDRQKCQEATGLDAYYLFLVTAKENDDRAIISWGTNEDEASDRLKQFYSI